MEAIAEILSSTVVLDSPAALSPVITIKQIPIRFAEEDSIWLVASFYIP
jgi:hypothetical protein